MRIGNRYHHLTILIGRASSGLAGGPIRDRRGTPASEVVRREAAFIDDKDILIASHLDRERQNTTNGPRAAWRMAASSAVFLHLHF
jgi:hypothetical protein